MCVKSHQHSHIFLIVSSVSSETLDPLMVIDTVMLEHLGPSLAFGKPPVLKLLPLWFLKDVRNEEAFICALFLVQQKGAKQKIFIYMHIHMFVKDWQLQVQWTKTPKLGSHVLQIPRVSVSSFDFSWSTELRGRENVEAKLLDFRKNLFTYGCFQK